MFNWLKTLFGIRKGPPALEIVWSSYTPKPLPPATNVCCVEGKHGELIHYRCGHTQPERYSFNLYGDTITWDDENYERRDICGECWLEKLHPGVIRCARCGLGIPPGFHVALYNDDECYNPKWKTVVTGYPGKMVIGCARVDCEPGGFVAGVWMGDRVDLLFGQGSIFL